MDELIINHQKYDNNINQILLNVKKHINEKIEFNYDKKLLEEKKNFIITPGSIERIKE